jgi:two-component system sensor histidine kinase HydH
LAGKLQNGDIGAGGSTLPYLKGNAMMDNAQRKNLWPRLLPWAILGSLGILTPIAFFLAASDINKDKANMTQLLVEKGAGLIRSFEAGARMGMMGMGWGAVQVQRLLVETAQQPDILYLVVTDENGVAVAHSDPEKIGQKHGGLSVDQAPLVDPNQLTWRKVGRGGNRVAFEVYKRFKPISGTAGPGWGRKQGMMMQRSEHVKQGNRLPPQRPFGAPGDWCRPYWNYGGRASEKAHYIFVGLDMGPLESARVEARRHTLVMTVGVVVVGFAGLVSLFLAQGYRLARRSLAKIRAFSDQVVESLPMGLIATDENGRVAVFNETAETVLDHPTSRVLGNEAALTLPAELWRLTDGIEKKGALMERDIECQTGSETAVPLRVSAARLRSDESKFLGYVLIFRDLTEVRRLEQELERNKRLASLGNLAAGVAHEIRNPLSSIKGFATYFRDRLKDRPEDQSTATTMIQEVERLDRVIGQLLEFARPSRLKITSVRMSDLVQHSLKLIEADIRTRHIEVQSDVPANLHVPMDGDRISQVLLNLYLNAIQAMGEGGTLRVKIERIERQRQTRISVTDNGQGIDSENLDRIFDPYFTTKSDGTGLGLAIVHKIVQAHGGEVEVESLAGQGTTVKLTIPDIQEAHDRD